MVVILAALSITAGILRWRDAQHERSLQTASLNDLIGLSKSSHGDARVFHYLALRAREVQARKLAMDSYWRAVQLTAKKTGSDGPPQPQKPKVPLPDKLSYSPFSRITPIAIVEIWS
jgi:hypothetical protein